MTEESSERPALSAAKRVEKGIESVLFNGRWLMAPFYPDWPDWMTEVDFGALKQKLLASIVAISAIQVLKVFMNLDASFSPERLGWLVGIHLVFVVSTLVLAFADRVADGNASH